MYVVFTYETNYCTVIFRLSEFFVLWATLGYA